MEDGIGLFFLEIEFWGSSVEHGSRRQNIMGPKVGTVFYWHEGAFPFLFCFFLFLFFPTLTFLVLLWKILYPQAHTGKIRKLKETKIKYKKKKRWTHVLGFSHVNSSVKNIIIVLMIITMTKIWSSSLF